MTTQDDNKAIVSRIIDALNSGNVDSLDQLIDTNVTDDNPQLGQGPGRQGLKNALNSVRTAFPDLHASVQDIVAQGDTVAVHAVGTGTHKGTFLGVSPTNKQITFRGFGILRISGGKVVERKGSLDHVGLMQQLGIKLPQP